MKYLLIDTSGPRVLCMAANEGKLCLSDAVPMVNTSTAIMSDIDRVLTDAGLTVDALDAVACVVGPGSFTGLRIGVSVANALCERGPLRLPCPLLSVLSWGRGDVLAAIPSRAGFSYTAQGEMTVEQVASLPSVGIEGSGARCILTREEYIDALHAYVLAHFDTASTDFLEPVYLKKSQAERLREGQ